MTVEGRIYEAEMEKSIELSRVEEDEEELKKLKAQYGWLRISRVKLFMDLIFVCKWHAYIFLFVTWMNTVIDN